MIDFTCPKCKQPMSSPGSMAGEKETCPNCGNAAMVPNQPCAPLFPGGDKEANMASRMHEEPDSGDCYFGSEEPPGFFGRCWQWLTVQRTFNRALFDRFHLLAMILYVVCFFIFWPMTWFPTTPLSGAGLLNLLMPFAAILGGYDLLIYLLVRLRWRTPWREAYAGNFFYEIAGGVLVFSILIGVILIWGYDGFALRLNYSSQWAKLSLSEFRKMPFTGQEAAFSAFSKIGSVRSYLATAGGPCKFIVTGVEGAPADAVVSVLDATVKPVSKEWGDSISGKAVTMHGRGIIEATVKIPPASLPDMCRISGHLTNVWVSFPKSDGSGGFSNVSAAVDTDDDEICVLPGNMRSQIEAAQQRFAGTWWLIGALGLGTVHVFWWLSQRVTFSR